MLTAVDDISEVLQRIAIRHQEMSDGYYDLTSVMPSEH